MYCKYWIPLTGIEDYCFLTLSQLARDICMAPYENECWTNFFSIIQRALIKRMRSLLLKHVLNLDRNLKCNSRKIREPTWSPNHSLVAFPFSRNTSYSIYFILFTFCEKSTPYSVFSQNPTYLSLIWSLQLKSLLNHFSPALHVSSHRKCIYIEEKVLVKPIFKNKKKRQHF